MSMMRPLLLNPKLGCSLLMMAAAACSDDAGPVNGPKTARRAAMFERTRARPADRADRADRVVRNHNRMTPQWRWQRPAAFWPTALPSDGLAIEFDAEIIPTKFQGDGMTLALADVAAGAGPTDFGDSGGGLGYTSAPCCTGIEGIAVALDTSKNANDPSGNFPVSQLAARSIA